MLFELAIVPLVRNLQRVMSFVCDRVLLALETGQNLRYVAHTNLRGRRGPLLNLVVCPGRKPEGI